LALQPAPVWVCTPQLSVYVLLEFLHVEQLQYKRNGTFAVSSNLNGGIIRSSDLDYIEVTDKVTIELDRLCGLRFPALPEKKSSGSGTGCTQPREYKLRSYLIEK
jgi:hypothetical protein